MAGQRVEYTEYAELGGRTLPTGGVWSDTPEFQEGQKAVVRINRFEFGEDTAEDTFDEVWQLRFPFSGTDVTAQLRSGSRASAIMEIVADHLSEQLHDDDDNPGVDPSQVLVCVGGMHLKPTDLLPHSCGNIAEVVIRRENWDQLAWQLPPDLRMFVFRLSRRLDGDDRDWGLCGEFVQIVQAIHHLSELEAELEGATRGSGSQQESILQYLQEWVERTQPTCPSDLLSDLLAEIGISP